MRSFIGLSLIALGASCAQPIVRQIPINTVVAHRAASKIQSTDAPAAISIRLAWNANDPAEQITSYRVYELYYDGHTVHPWALRGTVTVPNWTGISGYGLHRWAVSSVNALRESPMSASVPSGNL